MAIIAAPRAVTDSAARTGEVRLSEARATHDERQCSVELAAKLNKPAPVACSACGCRAQCARVAALLRCWQLAKWGRSVLKMARRRRQLLRAFGEEPRR